MGKNKSRLQQIAASQAKTGSVTQRELTLREITILGLQKDSAAEKPHVNLKYYYPEYQCFSTWSGDQLKAFSSLCRKLSQVGWADVYKSAGSLGSKTGFGYTPHSDLGCLPSNPELKDISPDLRWFELRVDVKARVHGFRVIDAFYLVFLDCKHAIHPM